MNNIILFIVILLIVSNIMSSIVNYFTMQKYEKYTELVHDLNNEVVKQNKQVMDIYNAIVIMGKKENTK